ncbi:MAG: glutamylcysteine synthetase [Oscillospiraceae bacterium]|nr:glutamylcysteine synthetase [Oscillospiraceae bacterium]
MNSEQLSAALYEKYISPTKKRRAPSIGIEIEMPVVNLNGEAVSEETIIRTADAFRAHFGFEPSGTDANGDVNSMTEPETGDNLSFDCSYSNLELSFGKDDSLHALHQRFVSYYRCLQDLLAPHGYTLTGMGINPNYNINHNQPIPNERYRMLYHYLHSYSEYGAEPGRRFHERPDFGTFTSASQVQLDAEYDTLIDTINVFGLLEPYKALLFANSYLPDYPDYLCSRNMLWEHSMQGYNPHNIGMFAQPLRSVDELLEYIKSQSVYCTMRDGKYVNFKPVAVRDYFTRSEISGEYFDGKTYRSIRFAPERGDLQYLRTFKFEDLTYRGTIEYRSSCCQPIRDVMTVAAFHTGLSTQLPALRELLEHDTVIYGHGYSADELQHMLSLRELPGFLDRSAVSAQLCRILDLAAAGLDAQGRHESEFLAPLYDRARNLTNPAKDMLQRLESGVPMKQIIADYAEV